MALPVLVPNATNALTTAESPRRPGRSQTYTHKARDPLIREQITAAFDGPHLFTFG